MLIPKDKIANIPGITIMDGNFVSLYPRSKDKFSISSVKYTPIYKFNNYKNIEKIKDLLKSKKNQNKIKKNISNHFLKYINLKFNLKKSKLETSFKIKLKKDTNSLRTTDLIIEKKLISVFCGKLDTVPLILNKLRKKLIIH